MPQTHRTRVLIIGAGAAGYTAAIYAARASLEPILVAGLQPGGQLMITTDVENYPGFAEVIQGPWLMEQMARQAAHVGTTILGDIIVSADFSTRPFRCVGDGGDLYLADAVVIATGAQARWLGLPSESGIAGGGRLGLRHLRRVLLPRQARRGRRRRQYRGRGGALSHPSRRARDADPSPRSAPRREDPASGGCSRTPRSASCGTAWWRRSPRRHAPRRSAAWCCATGEAGNRAGSQVDGVFVAIGHTPNTALFAGQVAMDAEGYILTEPGSTRTSVAGVFAAGDVQDKMFRQAVTAAGTGCMAALEAEKWLAEQGEAATLAAA